MLKLHGVHLSDKHIELLSENVASKHIQFQHSKPINMDTFRLPEDVDICFVELVLNSKDDFKYLKELKTSMKKDSTLVVITSQKNPKMIELAKLFADDCLQSPVELKTFKQIVVLKAKQLLIAQKKQRKQEQKNIKEQTQENEEEPSKEGSPKKKETLSTQSPTRKVEKESKLDNQTAPKQKEEKEHNDSHEENRELENNHSSVAKGEGRHDATPFLADVPVSKPKKGKESSKKKKEEPVRTHEVSNSPTEDVQHVQQDDGETSSDSQSHVSPVVETRTEDVEMDNSVLTREPKKISTQTNTENREDTSTKQHIRGGVPVDLPHSRTELSSRVSEEEPSEVGKVDKEVDATVTENDKKSEPIPNVEHHGKEEPQHNNQKEQDDKSKEQGANETTEPQAVKVPKIVIPKIVPAGEVVQQTSQDTHEQKGEEEGTTPIPVIKPIIETPTTTLDVDNEGAVADDEGMVADNAAEETPSISISQSTDTTTSPLTEDKSEKTLEDLKDSSQVLHVARGGVIAIEDEEVSEGVQTNVNDVSPSTQQTDTDTSTNDKKYTLSEEYLKDTQESEVERKTSVEEKDITTEVDAVADENEEQSVSKDVNAADKEQLEVNEPLTTSSTEEEVLVDESNEEDTVEPLEEKKEETTEPIDHVVITDDGKEFIFAFDEDEEVEDDENDAEEVTAEKEGKKENFSQLSPNESNDFSHERNKPSNQKDSSHYPSPNLMGIERKIQEMNELMRQQEQKKLEEKERIKQLEREKEKRKKSLEVKQPPMHIEKPRHLENLEKKKSRRLFDMFFKK